MNPRPKLTNLGGRLAEKPAASAAASTEPAASEPKAAVKAKAGAQPDGRKGVLLRLNPRAWFALKSLAAEQTMEREELYTMQSALEEAVNDLFKKFGKPPIA